MLTKSVSNFNIDFNQFQGQALLILTKIGWLYILEIGHNIIVFSFFRNCICLKVTKVGNTDFYVERNSNTISKKVETVYIDIKTNIIINNFLHTFYSFNTKTIQFCKEIIQRNQFLMLNLFSKDFIQWKHKNLSFGRWIPNMGND